MTSYVFFVLFRHPLPTRPKISVQSKKILYLSSEVTDPLPQKADVIYEWLLIDNTQHIMKKMGGKVFIFIFFYSLQYKQTWNKEFALIYFSLEPNLKIKCKLFKVCDILPYHANDLFFVDFAYFDCMFNKVAK